MALVEQQAVVQFRAGIESKEDRKGVLPTKLLLLENAVLTKVVTPSKRFGYEDLGVEVMGSDEPLPPGLALGKRSNELLSFSADQVHSRVDDAGKWMLAGEMRSVIATLEPVAKTGTNQTMAECAVGAGLALYGWEDSAGGVWYAVLDDATRRVVVAPAQAHASATRPRCIALGSYLYLAYALATAHEIRLLRFSTSAPTVAPVENVIATDLDGTVAAYDWAAVGDDAALVWALDTGGIRLAFLDASGVIGGTGLGHPLPVTISAAVASAVSVCANGTHIVVAWTDAGFTVKYQTRLVADLTAVHAARTVATEAATPTQVTCAFDGRTEGGTATAWAIYEVSAADAQNYLAKGVRTDVDASTYTAHDSWTQRGCGLASKAFEHDGDAFVHLGRDSSLYRTYYTVRARGRMVCTRLLSGLGNGHLERAHLPSVQIDAAGTWYWPAIYVTDVETADGAVFTESGIRKVSLEFESDEAFRSVELGDTTYVAGGMLHAYDGCRVTEAEFHYGIDDVAAPTLGAPTGAGIADGTYGYIFVSENVLANGEIQRGPVSKPVVVTVTGGPRKVTFAIPTYRLTAMPNARIGAFRSIDGDSSSYYRVSSFDPSTVGDVNGYVANDATVDTVAFVDEMTDADLEEQDPLYINGGVVSNDPLGGAKLVAAGKGRVFVVDAADPYTVYASQERADGFAIETSPRLRIDVERGGGPITGIIVAGEVLLIFKETAIYRVTGPGPLANPDLGGGWSSPELLLGDLGCIAPDSLSLIGGAVAFMSRRGPRIVSPDGAIASNESGPIGGAVEAYNDQPVTAATLIDDRSQLRLLTSEGKTLHYDYERDQWSVFANHEGRDAIVVDGTYHYLRNDGRVWRETVDEYADGGTAQIRKAVETAWVTGGHKQAQMYVWHVTVLGQRLSPHALRFRYALDYQEGWTGAPIDIDPDEGRDAGTYGDGAYGDGPYGGGADDRYQFQIHIGQECQAIRFRFEDIEADGDYGASFELSELHLSFGIERSNYVVEEARRY